MKKIKYTQERKYRDFLEEEVKEEEKEKVSNLIKKKIYKFFSFLNR